MERMREARNGLLCAVLTAQLILSPVLGAAVQAAGVTPDPNAAADKRPSMEAAPNGVPVVNITAANGSGLSHNQYHDFNVHQQGLILNNSSSAANSQLSGILAGNPNFNGNHGAEARAVLNEVTSANRSRIEGYIEVNGRAADVILEESDRMTELVEELLDISKIDMGRQRLTLSEMDVRELLYDSIRAVEPAAAGGGITITPDFPETPVMVSCDDTRLRRAVTNILSNGVRYARSELCLTCRTDKRHVTIRIQDDGDGIAEADLPHIFDRFYMGKSGKSGIGLALTKEIIHLHKGTIRAYNGDTGAVFEISIPVSR